MVHQIIKLAQDIGIHKLWLEGDSKNIIDCLNKKTEPTWMVGNIIEESIQILSTFKNIHMAHEYREANHVADRLANWATRDDENKRWNNGQDLPREILDLIEWEQIPRRLGSIS